MFKVTQFNATLNFTVLFYEHHIEDEQFYSVHEQILESITKYGSASRKAESNFCLNHSGYIVNLIPRRV